jgi:hypothetical protein
MYTYRYSEEPAEEEKEAMSAAYDQVTGKTSGTSSSAHDDDMKALQKEVAKLDWNTSSKAGLKAAAVSLTKVLQNHTKQFALPENDKEAIQKVGTIIQQNRDKTLDDILTLIIQDIGFTEEKQAKEEKKEKASLDACDNPANGPVFAALSELAELYFKEGTFCFVGNHYTLFDMHRE